MAVAQKFNPNEKPNTYRSVDNPHYWKNKMPHLGYWQQDVYYDIKANVDEKTDIIDGSMVLTYYNNSPDKLDFVFFHLYQNAFQPNSHLNELYKNNNYKQYWGQYEKAKLGTTIEDIIVSYPGGVDGIRFTPETELDNTILKVFLPTPLESGDSLEFMIDFKTYFDMGSTRRRMKMFYSDGMNKHYDGVLWYPRMSVYDRKFGWTTDQHFGHEFYGEFGTFDVELTFSSNYIVEATGFLTNRDEMLPDSLREKLDVVKFKNKPWNEKSSIIIPYDSLERKTWIYHAENVHDFAFTADPTYRIGEAEWNGIKCYSLVQEPHASKWQNAAEYVAKCIKIFSEDIGMYAWNKIIVADARDGMEYPMITLDGGQDPTYRGLLAHEIGHMWFYGQVGNNETYRAALDEGFTEFLETWAQIKIDGEYLIEPKKDTTEKILFADKYYEKFKKPRKVLDNGVYYSYIKDATKYNDAQLNTHSDDFNGAVRHGGGYRHVYFKMAAMLYNLQYVLGDELFLNSMKNYFATWKMAHPYFNDFRTSVINHTKVDLNWFFDQWLETTKTIDYKIKSVKKTDTEYKYEITFERKGEMQMPIDFTVIAKDGSKYNYHIPNTWFIKKTDATILTKWYGWGKLYKDYTATLNIPSGISDVIIDPSNRMADKYMLNNSYKAPLDINFDSKVYNMSDWKKYQIFIRPDVWYNGFDGLKIGMHTNGNYLRYHHNVETNFWVNTGIGQLDRFDKNQSFNDFSYRIKYRTGLDKYSKHASLHLQSSKLDGILYNNVKIKKQDYSQKNTMYIELSSSMINENNLNYLLYPNEWSIHSYNSSSWNNQLSIGLRKNINNRKIGKGKLEFRLTSSSLGSNYNFAKFQITSITSKRIKSNNLRTRLFAQYSNSVWNRHIWPNESMLYLAGASPEELINNKYTRSIGFIPESWTGYGENTNHFHMGGGLNLRGYSGYLAPEIDNNGNYQNLYKGTNGYSINLELDIKKLEFNFKNLSLTTYLFYDAGSLYNGSNLIQNNFNINFNEIIKDIKMDAGIGTILKIKGFRPLNTVKPINLRIDFPLFLNKIPNIEEDYFKFRWVIGLNRSF